MRRTLGLVLALPTTLVLVAALPSPAPSLPDTASAVAPSPAETTPSTLPVPAPPAGEVGEGLVDSDDRRPDAGTDAGSLPSADAAPPREDDRDGADGTEGALLVAAVPDAGGGVGTGPRWRYTIEVEPATGLDPDDVARQVRAALTDERSWVRERTLEQVADPARARIRVVIATPATVDALCARAGLRTVGIYSCWNGRIAALNAWRWEVGADGFADLATYRTYLVNHEFGHGLGYGHVGCPAPGDLAPVMMQQSKGLDGCLANGWPSP